MTNREIAEAYVRERLPELMELSFGCEVRFESGRVKYSGSVLIPKNSRGMIECFADNQIVYVANEDKFEIIGHPIQLAHVLRLVNENYRGEFLEIWDLEKSWSEQREGVYIWLCQEWSL